MRWTSRGRTTGLIAVIVATCAGSTGGAVADPLENHVVSGEDRAFHAVLEAGGRTFVVQAATGVVSEHRADTCEATGTLTCTGRRRGILQTAAPGSITVVSADQWHYSGYSVTGDGSGFRPQFERTDMDLDIFLGEAATTGMCADTETGTLLQVRGGFPGPHYRTAVITGTINGLAVAAARCAMTVDQPTEVPVDGVRFRAASSLTWMR